MIYCIDLDGTLIKNDMSVTSFKKYIKVNPLNIFKCIYWYIIGTRSLVKFNLGQWYKFDVNDLPYNKQLIQFLENLSKQDPESEIYLVSGSTQQIVDKIASNFSFFKAGFGSSKKINLTGNNKLLFIKSKFEEKSICYAGNSKVDFKVWKGVSTGIVVSDDETFINKAKDVTQVIGVYKNIW
ncbi:MAG: hypothetical protein ACI4V7_00590 [Succinivibrionaceae bacterium]